MSIRLFLGGSFDPVHDGHLAMVKAVHKRMLTHHSPFYLYFLPTAGNPFKGKATASTHRLAMLNLACQLLQKDGMTAHVCTHEIYQTPPIYTIDTVRHLSKIYPNDTLVFIMGGDSLANFHRWRDYQAILTHTKIWAFGRVGDKMTDERDVLMHLTDDFDEFMSNKKAIFYDKTTIMGVSSSQIRHDLQDGKTPTHLPLEVLQYIKEVGLYR